MKRELHLEDHIMALLMETSFMIRRCAQRQPRLARSSFESMKEVCERMIAHAERGESQDLLDKQSDLFA